MKRSISVAIAFVFGTIVGVSIGSLLQSDDPSAAAMVMDSTNSETSRSPSFPTDEEPAPARASPSANEAAIEPTGSATAAETASTHTEVTSGEAVSESAPIGDGVIGGRVTDSSDAPLAGCVVIATHVGGSEVEDYELAPSGRGRAAPKPRTLEDALAAARSAFRAEHASRMEAATDSQGEYRFAGLQPGLYEISAWADGYVVESLIDSSEVEPGRRIDFVATAAIDVPVIVRLPNGEIAERASLAIDHDASNSDFEEPWNAKEPRLRLPRGRFRICAFARWLRDGSGQPPIETISEKVAVDLSSGAVPAAVELTLAPRLGIRGRVSTGSSMCSGYLRVKLAALPAGQKVDIDLLRRVNTERWVHASSPTFAFADLKPGRYVLGVILDDESPLLATREVTIVDRMIDVDLELEDLSSFRTITALVYGPGNEPLNDVNFEFRVQRGEDAHYDSNDLTHLDAGRGRYSVVLEDRITRHLDQPEPESVVHLIARTERFGSRSVPVDIRTKQVEIRFSEPAFFEIQLLGFGGNGFESRLTLNLQATGTENRGGWGRSAELQADGSSRIGPVAPGEYLFEIALRRTTGWGTRTLFRHQLTASPGVNPITLQMPQLHLLTMWVPGVDDGTIYLESSLGSDDEAHIENGKAVLAELPAATYEIRYDAGDDQRELQIAIPDQTTVTLPIPRPPDPDEDGNGR